MKVKRVEEAEEVSKKKRRISAETQVVDALIEGRVDLPQTLFRRIGEFLLGL
jgi:hypothetical protein